MSVENIGSFNKMFDNFTTNKWVKPESLDTNHSFELKGPTDLRLNKEDSKSFSQLLAQSLGDVNKLQTDADKAIVKLVTGKSKNLHETMLAVEKAEIAFKTMNQVRQKVIEAYKDVMRMQV